MKKKSSFYRFIGILSFVIPMIGFILFAGWIGGLVLSAMLFIAFFKNKGLLGEGIRAIGRGMYKVLQVLFFGFITVMIVVGLFKLFESQTYIEPEETYIAGNHPKDFFVEKDSVVTHTRYWKDYSGTSYEMNYEVNGIDYQSSFFNRNKNDFYIRNNGDWTRLYQNMVQHDQSRLSDLYQSFDSIRESEKLNKYEFAEMVVSFVQDIPYSFILQTDCNNPQEEFPNLYNDLKKCDFQCCLGPVKYGVQAPVEFIGNLKGDCDTRTVLCFAVLKHFGYDVRIFGSNVYRHSILGINLPYYGKSKALNGKRYYTWETTAKGWEPGQISSDQTNFNYWHYNL